VFRPLKSQLTFDAVKTSASDLVERSSARVNRPAAELDG
jgi:hypothetical protein